MVPNKEAYEYILQSKELDKDSKDLFKDTVEYIEKLVSQNKQFDLELYKIYITQVKGYELPTIEQFMRIVLLLNLCGFELNLE